jgi:hypothetical protein
MTQSTRGEGQALHRIEDRIRWRALFGRRRWRRFVELAGYTGVELLSALAPDVCGDDVSVSLTTDSRAGRSPRAGS